MVPYRTITIDLTSVQPLTELVGRGNAVGKVTVMSVTPKGSAFDFVLRPEANGDDIDIDDFGVLQLPDGATNGIWWRNDTAQAGISVTLLVGFDSAPDFSR